MKRYLYIYATAALLSTTACTDFGDMNTNPDSTTKVTPGMLATNLILDVLKTDNSGVLGKGYMYDDFLGKYLVITELVHDEAFNRLSRVSFGTLTILNNISRMVEAAPEGNVRNSYQALGHFIRVKKFFDLTMRVGDIPYSQAMQGDDGLYYPTYDTQKEVFLGLLKELDEADRLFAEGAKFEGDIVYGGDPAKWRKAVNALQLRVLINLYKKAGDADLKVKERFQAVAARPLFTSNAENFQITYSDKAGQKYPYYKEGNNYMMFLFMSSIPVDTLKLFGDRRLFYYAKPTPASDAAELSPSEWTSYNGVNPVLTFADQQAAVNTKNASQPNDRYSELANSEPVTILNHSEINFIIAEAIARGFMSGDAKAHYETAIRSAMSFTADNTPDNPLFHHNMKITGDYIDEYLKGQHVAFATSPDAQIHQIIMQKYLASFLQLPLIAFLEHRRTGIPTFPINPASNMNTPPDKLPVRWMYPSNEFTYNTDNVNAAVSRQYSSDDYNEVMWLLK